MTRNAKANVMIGSLGSTRPSCIYIERPGHRVHLGLRWSVWSLLPVIFALPTFGMVGCSSPTDAPEPAGGGQEYALSFDEFASTVAPVLTERGCNAGGDCHGGGIRGTYQLSPVESPNLAADFEQTRLQVLPFALSESPILTKPLRMESGGERHEYEPFENREDPGYRAIESWVFGGSYQ